MAEIAQRAPETAEQIVERLSGELLDGETSVVLDAAGVRALLKTAVDTEREACARWLAADDLPQTGRRMLADRARGSK